MLVVPADAGDHEEMGVLRERAALRRIATRAYGTSGDVIGPWPVIGRP